MATGSLDIHLFKGDMSLDRAPIKQVAAYALAAALAQCNFSEGETQQIWDAIQVLDAEQADMERIIDSVKRGNNW